MGDRRVIRAHDDAVRATLDWIERDLLQTRGGDPITRRRPRVGADGMIVAGFRHLATGCHSRRCSAGCAAIPPSTQIAMLVWSSGAS